MSRPIRIDLRVLSPQQRRCVQLKLAGKSTKAICKELELADGTVRSHLSQARAMLGITRELRYVSWRELALGAQIHA